MTSISRLKALKRHRVHTAADEGCPHEAHTELLPLPPGPHAPAKPESQVLRRLCAQTGLAENEVREHKTYRRLLAHAGKPKEGKPMGWRHAVNVRKQVTSSTGMHPLNPAFFDAFNAAWLSHRNGFSLGRRHANVLRDMSSEAALQLSLLKGQAPVREGSL